MKTLYCDIETYSSADLKRTGAVKYAEAEDFEILLMSYAFDDEPIQVWDFTKDGTPPWLAWALTDPTIVKKAWNMAFERACFNSALGIFSRLYPLSRKRGKGCVRWRSAQLGYGQSQGK